MNLGLFEDAGYRDLLPLTWLRPAFELVCGRDRLVDKVVTHADGRLTRVWTRPELAAVVRERFELESHSAGSGWCLLNARLLVRGDFTPPPVGTAWVTNGSVWAVSVTDDVARGLQPGDFLDAAVLDDWLTGYRHERPPATLQLINHPWELPLANSAELQRQCQDGGAVEGKIYPGAHLLDPSAIHIAAGAVVKPGVVLDAEQGPIWIDRDALIESNAVVQGPCYVGRGAIVRPGAVIREATSIGPVCRVGGEIEASIIQGYSNKQHDGFLGHSYLGAWVNIGADTITSDLKNTYGPVRVFVNGVGVESGQRLVGATIGDHSKTGIGTILPTGCVVGIASNVFSQRSVPKFVPSFAWLTDEGMTEYRLDKALSIARVVMERRDIDLTNAEAALVTFAAEAAREIEASGWS